MHYEVLPQLCDWCAGACHRVQWARKPESSELDLDVQQASAVRLLYSALQHLEEIPDVHDYRRFFRELDARVRQWLTIPDVLDFLRIALMVPEEEYLLLVPLINEAQQAVGTFGKESQKGVRHWTLLHMCC